MRGRKGQIRGRNGEDGKRYKGKAFIKHTGANRRCLCLCVIVVVGSDGCRIKTGINRGKGEDGVDIWEWHMQVWQDVYMSV